jgi:hypothetical protein
VTKEDAKKVWGALTEININPVAILNVPLFPPLAKEYVEGKMSKAQFQNGCENLNIFAGGKLSGSPPAHVPLTSLN